MELFKLHKQYPFKNFGVGFKDGDIAKNKKVVKCALEIFYDVKVDNIKLDYDNELVDCDLIGELSSFEKLAKIKGKKVKDLNLVKV